MSNVIILTSGLSGSSVLSNLISQSGYWTGDETCKKHDYDTHENAQLVELNNQIIEAAAYRGNYTRNFDGEALSRNRDSDYKNVEGRKFINYCNQHSPWIWKDPRLWVTFDYWAPLLRDNDYKVIILDRSMMQRWISVNLRRQIQSWSYTTYYTQSVNKKIREVVKSHGIEYLELNFDDLLLTPEVVLNDINKFRNYSGRFIEEST